MNQIGFSTFHMCAMGCAGYVAGQVLQLNPKLAAVIGIVSSLSFQILSDAFYKDDDHYNMDKNDKLTIMFTPDQIKEHKQTDRTISNMISVFLTIGIATIGEEISKQGKLSLILLSTSYIAAKVGTYFFLKDRDFSIFGHDRPRVW